MAGPDFAHPAARVAVFLDGCFWHGCPEHCRAPKGNRTFWERKIARNRARDVKVTGLLQAEGWCIIRVWEHDLKNLSEQIESPEAHRRTIKKIQKKGGD